MTPAEYLRIARRWWWVVVLGGVLAGAAAAAVSAVLPEAYTGRATLVVTGSDAGTGLAATYASLMTSSTHIERVVGALPGSDAGDLRASVSARVLPQTLLLEVSATDSSAARAARVANAFAESFPGYLNDTGLGGSGRAQVVSIARTPEDPTSPNTRANVALGVVLGLLAVAGAVAVVEYRDDTVDGAEPLRRLDVPYLGGMPEIPAPEGADMATFVPSLRDLTFDDSLAAAFARLEELFWLAAETAGVRTILVTSPVEGDGTTTSVANLAQALASSSRHVLAVDANLASPGLHRYFALSNSEGLSTALGKGPGSAPLDEVGDGLTVLTAGPSPVDPRRRLASASLPGIFQDLAQEADLVLVDGPPVLHAAPQVASLLAVVDAVVLVVRAQSTRRGQLEDAVTAVRASGVPLLGAIMNGITPPRSRPQRRAPEAGSEPSRSPEK